MSMMTDKDIQVLADLFARNLEKAKNISKEEALRSFMNAGILDSKGNFTEPYKHLTTLLPR